MSKFLYSRLARQNVARNRRFTVPYMLTGIFTVAMFYNTIFMAQSPDLSKLPGASILPVLLNLGTIVVGIFSTIFLLYTNSFIIKRRSRELGLYNLLGMEKKHIARMLIWESLIITLIAVVGGLGFGILLSKLLLLALCRCLKFPVVFGFRIMPESVWASCALFVGIYFIALVFNLLKLKLSKPIELIRGENAGEKEPKTKALLAIVGFLCLGGGYYISLTTESIADAVMLFFLAVVLVIVGTYCLFTAGSIAVLKALKKKKSYYYKPKHFVSVSGMLYRMKQNAVGLANICILSTMVLVMLSTTVCLYIGIEDSLDARYWRNVHFGFNYSESNLEDYIEAIDSNAEKAGLTISNSAKIYEMSTVAYRSGDSFFFRHDEDYAEMAPLVFLTSREYSEIAGEEFSLESDEICIYTRERKIQGDSIDLFGMEFKVKYTLDEIKYGSMYDSFISDVGYIIVKDLETLESIRETALGFEGASVSLTYDYWFDISGSDEEVIECYDAMKYEIGRMPGSGYMCACRQADRADTYSLYGGLLFLGAFLSIVFLMGTVMIIYYKQVSEGYDDRRRFEIMQKVGMSKKEVTDTVKSQVLVVFFLPLVGAVVHLAAAFNIVSHMMLALGLSNMTLFLLCSLGTVLAYALGYFIVYKLTERTYAKIVR